MTPLPAGVRGGTRKSAKNELTVWRLERAIYAPIWDAAEGAFQVGGRWSPAGRRVVYCSLDPSTAILEVAVHKGFKALDTVAHRLLCIRITRPAEASVIDPTEVPNRNWLNPGVVSAGQQAFGSELLDAHPLVFVPSVVSSHSWNVLIDVAAAAGMFELMEAEVFALDTRLHPARAA